MKKLGVFLMLVCVITLLSNSVSQATIETFGFYNITNNNPGDAAIGEAQLSVEVSDEYIDQVLFTLINSGPEASAISEVYFDNGTLLGIASIINNPPDVVFVEDASPGELPGANLINPPFETTLGFLAESSPPPPQKGVNPGEEVGILFDLQAGGTYDDVISELYSGDLRIGIHVIGFESCGSESFVNVPEPATMALLGIGGLALFRRRK